MRNHSRFLNHNKINILFLPNKVLSHSSLRYRVLGFAKEFAKYPQFNVYILKRDPSTYKDFKYCLRHIFTKKSISINRKGPIKYVKIPYIPSLSPPFLRYNENLLFKLINNLKINVVINEFAHSIPVPFTKDIFYIYDLVDDFGAFHNSLKRPFINNFVKKELSKCNLVLTGSIALGEIAKARRWIKDYRCIHSGTNVETYSKISREEVNKIIRKYNLSKKFVIGHIGYQDMRSGIDFIIEVFKKAKKRIDNLSLLIVGPGPRANELKQIYQDDPDILFVGPVPSEEVQKYFMACDIGVLPYINDPSVQHAFPLRFADFFAAKKIIISWPFGDMKYLNFPNVILAERNYDDWVNTIVKAKDMVWQDEWNEIIKKFSWEYAANQLKTYLM